MIAGIDSLIDRTVAAISRMQRHRDGANHVRGEFPMRIHGTVPHEDFNFLSGYALLHLVCAARIPGGLPAKSRCRIDSMIRLARDVPAYYQSADGTQNWYRENANGEHAPRGYSWPRGVVVSICNDLDDTAVGALLCSMRLEFKPKVPYRVEVFTTRVYDPARHAIRSTSSDRLREAGISAGVYLTWCLDPKDHGPNGDAPSVWLPAENSVELVTVGNVVAAVDRMCPTCAASNAQATSKQFVNRYLQRLMTGLIERGDVHAIERAARYYPRAPFAPVAYLLRDHVLSGGALLTPQTLRLIDQALLQVGPEVQGSAGRFAASAYWLDAVGWSSMARFHERSDTAKAASRFLPQFVADHYSGHTNGECWPDFIFFKDAHVGDYSGAAHSQALVVEALSLARAGMERS